MIDVTLKVCNERVEVCTIQIALVAGVSVNAWLTVIELPDTLLIFLVSKVPLGKITDKVPVAMLAIPLTI